MNGVRGDAVRRGVVERWIDRQMRMVVSGIVGGMRAPTEAEGGGGGQGAGSDDARPSGPPEVSAEVPGARRHGKRRTANRAELFC